MSDPVCAGVTGCGVSTLTIGAFLLTGTVVPLAARAARRTHAKELLGKLVGR